MSLLLEQETDKQSKNILVALKLPIKHLAKWFMAQQSETPFD